MPTSPSSPDIAMNLRRLRSARALTQDALAQRAGLSRAAYRNLEAGRSEPRARTVLQLAAALGVKPPELLRPAPPPPRARFRSRRRLKEREQLLVTVARQLEDYAELERLVDERGPYALGGLQPVVTDPERRPIVAARAVRQALGLTEAEPIRDICGLLEERAGIKVLRLPVATDAFFGLAIADGDGGPAIVVNTWDRISVERWIFTVAHELGHLVLHETDFRSDQVEESADSEREADIFAGHFLMPQALFDSEWEETRGLALYDRVLKVKRIFRVSYRTVLYRLYEKGELEIWARFQAEARRRTGRTLLKTDEPAALQQEAFAWGSPEPRRAREPRELVPDDFVPDRRWRLVRRAIENGLISLGRGAEILGIPLRDMRQVAASWV